MNSSGCSTVICQPGGHKQNHDIGAQCGATAPDRTVQVPVIVNQTQNSANPTQQLVVGSRPSKYTRILAGKLVNRKAETTTETVRKMCSPPVPTTIQVIGTVTLDTINYQDFIQTFKSANQQNQWKVKKQWTSEISENTIFGETDILKWKVPFWRNPNFWLYKFCS